MSPAATQGHPAFPIEHTSRGKSIREAIVSHSENGTFAIRRGPWKAIFGTDGSGGWVAPPDDPPSEERGGQLYNLDQDPREQNDLYSERPEVVESLRRLLVSYQEEERSAPGKN